MKKLGALRKGQDIADTYEVLFYIGEGAFGEVYRVKHRFLGVQVLKLFKADYDEMADIELIAQEAKILAQITHPNVVRVFEANSFEMNGRTRHFLTMGFVSGESVAQLLARREHLTPAEACSIAADALEGLKAAFALDPPVIHRDINTDNILLSYDQEKPRALLSDFGLAQAVDSGGHLPGAAGRYPYMAPECFWGTHLHSSDIFSMGVTMYRMLTGLHPWQYDFKDVDGDPEDIITEVLRARKALIQPPSIHNEDVNERLDAIVMRSLASDLETRYATAAQMLADIRAWQSGETSSAEIPSKLSTDPTTKDEERPKGDKGFALIAGMSDLKETLYQEIIRPLAEPDLFKQYGVTPPNGMLLYGPPGCGKTFIAQKLAEEIGYYYIEVKPSDLASTYVHGTQEKIGAMFKEAAEKAPTLIFVDEVDAIVPRREEKLSQHYASEVNEFLAQMTECSSKGIFVVAATNRPDRIDPAILRTGRMDKAVYLGPPDLFAREQMFRLHLEGRPVEPEFDFQEVAAATDLYVSSDIKFLVNEASRRALQERSSISMKHFREVVRRSAPSVSPKQLALYEQFRDQRTFDES